MHNAAYLLAIPASRASTDEVCAALRLLGASEGLRLASDDEPAQHTTRLISDPVHAWHFVLDDRLHAGPKEFYSASNVLSQALATPIVGIVASDGRATELHLCVAGRLIASIESAQREMPLFQAWADAIGAPAQKGRLAEAWWQSGGGDNGLTALMRELTISSQHLRLDVDEEGETPGRHELVLRWCGSSQVVPSQDASRSALEIPRWLCAPAREVRRSCVRHLKQVLAGTSWPELMKAWDMIPVEHAPHMLVLHGPPMDSADDSDNVMLYPVPEAVCDIAARDSRRLRAQVAGAVLSGLDHFWFSLSALGWEMLLPRAYDYDRCRYDEQLERTEALGHLTKLLRWWEAFCALDHRFFGGDWLPRPWPWWGATALGLCQQAGMDEERRLAIRAMGASEAGTAMLQWVRAGPRRP